MCAICGIRLKSKRVPLEQAARWCAAMAARMAHRGPDDQGAYVDAAHRVVLGHRRLSIIDLSPAGRQPMFNEDHSVAVLVNGEIYNYRELQEQLRSRGHRFQSHCDVEVVAHLFEEKGAVAWSELRGMYAAAVYDVKSGVLHLARDPLGIKPLYVFETPDWVAFASELRAFEALAAPREMDWDGIADFLLLGSVPAPRTQRRGVWALRPGEEVKIDSGGIQRRGGSPVPGWCQEIDETSSRSVISLKECLRDSVKRHLVSDAPIGVFLSGGIDSGTMAGLAAESSASVRTVSVTIPGDELDEGALARETAALFHTDHVAVELDQSAFEKDLARFFEHLDLPSIDGLNTFIVAKAARQAGLTVALSGVGGDELFAGYPSFDRMPRLARVYQAAAWGGTPGRRLAAWGVEKLRPNSGGARYAEALRTHPADLRGAYLAMRGLFVGKFLRGLLRPELEPFARAAEARFLDETGWAVDGGVSPRLAVGGLELTRYMGSQLLRDTDVMSMAHSLEVRTPLVDVEVVKKSLPFLTQPMGGDGDPKWPLRQALSRPLPRSVVHRPKQGFIFPWQRWLRGVVLEEFDRQLAEESAWKICLRPDAVRWWREAYVAGWAHWSCFWAIYVLMKFCGKMARPGADH